MSTRRSKHRKGESAKSDDASLLDSSTGCRKPGDVSLKKQALDKCEDRFSDWDDSDSYDSRRLTIENSNFHF